MNQRSPNLQSQLLRQLNRLLKRLQRTKLRINILQVELPIDIPHTCMHSGHTDITDPDITLMASPQLDLILHSQLEHMQNPRVLVALRCTL